MSQDGNPYPSGNRDRSASRPTEPFGSREFAESFEASFRTLWLIAVGVVGEPALAEDVVQEAAIVALGKLEQFSPGTNFNAWMGRIVRFVALNLARKERKRRPVRGDHDAVDQLASDQESAAARSSNLDAVDPRLVKALDQLGEVARSCLLLRTIADMTYAEIAELLEIPEGTAMSHVHRTRHFLRDRLIDPSSDLSGERSDGA